MLIAVTGATGFLGRYIVNHLLSAGHRCRCWHRPVSDRDGFANDGQGIEWIPGRLDDQNSANALVQGADAVVHSALEHQGGWNPSDKNLIDFIQTNVVGSIRLIQAARAAGVPRFVFISTCAVHDVILNDRPLDEAHPLWPMSPYGAHKAAIEKFVHSFGLAPNTPGGAPSPITANPSPPNGWDICALRPAGIYGLAQPPSKSRWYNLVRDVIENKPIENPRGGKEVHAADVAKAVDLLLTAATHTPGSIAGQAYNCYDCYIAVQDVAQLAKDLTGSTSEITQTNTGPKNQIATSKLQTLGMPFGGKTLLRQTVKELVDAIGNA